MAVVAAAAALVARADPAVTPTFPDLSSRVSFSSSTITAGQSITVYFNNSSGSDLFYVTPEIGQGYGAFQPQQDISFQVYDPNNQPVGASVNIPSNAWQDGSSPYVMHFFPGGGTVSASYTPTTPGTYTVVVQRYLAGDPSLRVEPNDQSVFGSFTVQPASTPITNMTLNNNNATWAGSGITPSLTPTPGGASFSFNVDGSGTTANSAGTHIVNWWANSGYSGSGSIQWTINKGNQTTPSLSASPSSIQVGQTSTLTPSGGESSGGYVITQTGGPGTLSGTTYTPSSAGTGTFTVYKNGDSNWNTSGTSGATSVVVTSPKTNQPKPSISTAAQSITYGNWVDLVATGGAGTGSFVFVVQSGGGSLSGNRLTATSGTGSVVVYVYRNGDGSYNQSPNSDPVTFPLALAPQAAVSLAPTSASTTNGGTVQLTPSGGSGSGAWVFSVSAGGSVNGSYVFTASAIGTSTVTAYKASDGNYAASATTNACTITVNAADVYGNGSGYLISSGTDLDNVFENRTYGGNSTTASNTGLQTFSGADLSARYYPLSAGGTSPSATGFLNTTGADLSTVFAAKGTVNIAYNVATGGTVITDGNYKIHYFTTSGTLTFSQVGSQYPIVELLMAGGGGGGGGGASNNGGGGGGGGGVYTTIFTPAAQSYTLTIGAGGAGGTSGNGANGGNTQFHSSWTAVGGGGGGGYGSAGLVGASGGGSGRDAGAGQGGGTNAGGEGYAGGSSYSNSWASAGGGGGAGSTGVDGSNDSGARSGGYGQGGYGYPSKILGNVAYFSDGGGGAWQTSGGAAPQGGAGNGGAGSSGGSGAGGGATYYGGGGGGGQFGNGGSGYSGIIVVRYQFTSAGFLPNQLSGLVGWYDAGTYDNYFLQWKDKSGSGNHATVSGRPEIVTHWGGYAGATAGFTMLHLRTTDQIVWPSGITPSSNYTLFHVARYTGSGARSRIIQGTTANWLSGFWSGLSGQAYHSGWLTDASSNYHGDNWVYSTDQAGLYRSNGVQRSTSTGGNTGDRITVNAGAVGEPSDCYITEVIIYNRALSLSEIQQVETYLKGRYGL